MIISWYGQSFFEIAVKGDEKESVKIAIDPFDDSIGLKPPKVEADILLITHQHKDHNNKGTIKGEPFVIEHAGEYEVKGISIQGISAFHDNEKGKERGVVVIYKIEAEGIKICYLSDLGQKELTTEQLEEIDEIDILIIPIGGKYTINGKEAAEIISQIEPRMVIPMHYKIENVNIDLEGVDGFLKVMGEEKTAPEKKLKVSAKDLPAEETKIVLLEP